MFAYSLNPNSTHHCVQLNQYSNDTHRGDDLCHSIHWLTFHQWLTVKHKLCKASRVSVCIELCIHRARTLVAVLCINSEWHWLCLKERDKSKKEDTLQLALGQTESAKKYLA